ncbi:p-glycoprotein [Entamoeba histolytica]|uniref:Multidrug resistance protein 1 n=7 Tax=Entamoeba histolytica TaxID=5759 RepID=MDR1_ENTH1|nr:P-glycoprotein-1 [Entamoeba histolytica HM-1:IMSS]P16875.2 RecName: Full=Multidrug resistance protein 1; AltName: Full=P-glycoprotein [Entamoeba histolytica HM-1:IMSS]EAL46378.1 P-glycoprotein-1 [Entamoeba histolytica HM-1:IMSS]GAT96094.1 p-glycoprotein [Entamoeba histolytica]|eukprot:XP_651764.1 P-glycoprotein-1 [Entamoeba histolytica HM-1:IMSS]
MDITESEFTIFEVTPDPNELNNKRIKEIKGGKVNIKELFRYAGVFEIILLIIGIIGSIGVGCLNPLLMILTGDVVDTFVNGENFSKEGGSIKITTEEMNYEIMNSISDTINKLVLKMLYFAIGNMVAGFLQTICFFVLSEYQGIKIRSLYFKALLRQDPGWFDCHKTGELTSKIINDIQKIQDGMSLKFGRLFQTFSSFITGYLIGFIKCWDLTLVVLCMFPFIMVSMMGLGMSAGIFTMKSHKPFSEACSIAEQTIGNIRTVHSLTQERSFCESYNTKIMETDKYNIKKSIGIGTGLGCMMFFIMSSNALGSWYGNFVVRGKGGSDNVKAGTVLTVFMSVLLATQSLSQISTPINILNSAKVAAFNVYQTIDRIPDIDCQSIGGECPTECNGNIRFEDVQFVYPTRLSHHVLKGLDLEIKKGQTIALVGASGCGKSTTIQLIQRNYDPNGGRVTLDGKDIRELNIKWLRNQIGLVGQEPVLFAGTIRENIMLGAKEGATPSEEEMIECAKMANAHDFISKLPEGYDTIIGEKGALLSGGQKQRIAIARALIRNPSILLLDEATSALDTQSEKIVQEALEKASKGRTTIIVAHRLTTVRNADKICVFHQGEIIEQGKHQELMDLKGTYYGLVKRQSMEEEVDQETVENDLKKFREQEDKEVENISLEQTNLHNENSIVKQIKQEYKEEQKKLKHSNRFVLFRVIWNNYKHEYIFCTLGLIGGIGAGAAFPFYSLNFVDLIRVLMKLHPGINLTDEQANSILRSCMIIICIGIITMISFFCYVGLFMAAGEKMIGRIRRRFYYSIMHQNVSWFDRRENMVGAVTTKLTSDPTSLQGISAERVGDIIEIMSTVGFGFGIGLYFSWKLSLCILAVFPIISFFMFINGQLNSKNAAPAKAAYEQCGVTLVEVVEAMKTVQSLGKEDYFSQKYNNDLQIPKRGIIKWGPLLSITNAITNLLTFSINAYGYYLGICFMKKTINYQQDVPNFVDEIIDTFGDIQKALMTINSATTSFAQIGNVLPDVGKAVGAAKSIYNIIDRKPSIDCYSEEGETFNDVKGEIEFKNIHFRYPTRADNEVLKGISFKAEQGKTIALVGASGCGKSTTIQLIERFYDPTSGEVLLDGHNIKDLNIHFLRNQIGLVGQEPVLFAESVIDNIKRGVPEGVEVSNEQIYAAAKMANAHDFISAMPEGYNTMVGDRGSQLSGGQKQRIAIARALIRNPKVLLLDEATSALDSESEKIVQDALDKASKGRTTIVIAHRLSTIQNADKIYVIMRGKIVEQGKHQELIDLKGFYYTLAMQQFGTVN